jgi:hypothetical protein
MPAARQNQRTTVDRDPIRVMIKPPTPGDISASRPTERWRDKRHGRVPLQAIAFSVHKAVLMQAAAAACTSVGALGGIRTPDPQIRSLMLYPAELRALIVKIGAP